MVLSFRGLCTGLAALALVNASQILDITRPSRRHTSLEVLSQRDLQELASRHLHDDYSLERRWPTGTAEWDGFSMQDVVLLSVGDSSDGVSLDISCIECYGSASIYWDLNILDLEEDGDTTLSLTFTNTQAYVDLNFLIQGGGTYSRNLWSSDSSDFLKDFLDIDFGVVFYIDLVFSIDAAIDVSGGFQFVIPDGSHIKFTLDGEILAQQLAGAEAGNLPWTINYGSATIVASLRLRAEFGVGVSVIGVGAEAQGAVYVNLVEVVAQLQTTDTCYLEATEYWDINMGAYGSVGIVEDDEIIFGFDPTLSTTFYMAEPATQCWSVAEEMPTITATSTPSDVPLMALATGPDPMTTTSTAKAPRTTLVTGPDSTMATSEVPSTTLAAGSDPIITTSPVRYSSSSVPLTTLSTPSATPTMTTLKQLSKSMMNGTLTAAPAMHTSTVYSTNVYTVTKCAAAVINCPADWSEEIVVTQISELYTTVCPVTETQIPTVIPTTTAAPRKVTITEAVTLSQCPTPIENEFVPPTDVVKPTVHSMTTWLVVSGSEKAKTATSAATGAATGAATAAASGSASTTTTPGAVPTATSSNATISNTFSPIPPIPTAGASGFKSVSIVGGTLFALVIGILAL